MTNPLRPLVLITPLALALICIDPAGVATAEEGDEVTIVLVGDVGLNRNSQRVEPRGVRKFGFQTWANTTELIAKDINGDLNFLNVETVITNRNDLRRDTKGQRGPFNFRTHPAGLRHLVASGFNLLSLANNHSMDYGVAGLKETLKHVGALENENLAVATGIEEHAEFAIHYLEATKIIKETCPGAKISGGVSNLSFSFRGNDAVREAIHSAFLYHAVKGGMDMGIVNAGQLAVYEDIPADLLEHVEDILFNRREDATERMVELAETVKGGAKKRELDLSWRDWLDLPDF